ncbi:MULTISPECIES: response regulator transcription factor [unclassified Leptolyngbya]|uniref:response regulator transcription factor n=1 Tax=unclassified Leptolyngbya TaxID=2650499 RepID=UPI001685ACD3|nr:MULTISPECIES: response regulator transcription factor [unclassified Leptolyngbya]MBD1909941.1 response regulator transcription factor [Leptolyngbya sp. FACHB-8]MBD2154944.1 response regulator transcription factor [Leptolyngbya sp. FACHB-16]
MSSNTKQTLLVIDDHELVLGGTRAALQQHLPEATIVTAQTAQEAIDQVEAYQPSLAVVDLSMPEKAGDPARLDTGIQLLKTLMERYPDLNIVVQSAHVRSLVRLKPAINAHEGGFTIADKGLSMREMLVKVDWAMQGLIFTPKDMRNGLEVKPEWLEVLRLAFEEGLQDKAIAERMNVSERSVRHYWTKIQDVLDVYPDEGKNIRIQTEIRARQEGLIE